MQSVICADGHEPITHGEFHCPLCAALEDICEAEARTEDMRGLVYQLEATIDAMESIGDGLSPSDICGILAESEDTQNRMNDLRRKVRSLHDALFPTRKGPLGKQIDKIKAAYLALRPTD